MSAADTEVNAPSRSFFPALDMFFGSIGVAAGLVSLTFPFGRDQGFSYYVAREWVMRGAIPYRDSVSDKAPGISLMNAAAVGLFGQRQWGIRVADFACVIVLGILAAHLTTPRRQSVRPGLRGVGVLCACILYYGFHDFWNTAQAESWFSMLAVASVTAAWRTKSAVRGAVLSGLAMGGALIMKAPAACFVPVSLAVVATRIEGGDRRVVRGLELLGSWILGTALVPGVVLAYFSLHGALPAMLDLLRDGSDGPGGVMSDCLVATFAGLWVYNPMSTVFLGWIGYRLLGDRFHTDRRRWNRALLALALGLAGFAAIAIQRKFYPFHWVALIGPAAVTATMMADEASDAMAKRMPGPDPAALGLAGFALTFLLGYACSGEAISHWLGEHRALFAHRRGELSREAFSATFAAPPISFNYAESEEVGIWLRANTTPDQFVAVRGFEPEIYAVAERRYPGRFFSTQLLLGGHRPDREGQWIAEDTRALAANPPRYVVTIRSATGTLDGTDWFVPMGYHIVKEFRAYEILAR